MSILVTGGRGKTSSRLSTLLHEASIPFVVASRSNDTSSPYKQVRFDWSDETTWGTTLESTQIRAVYLVPMPSENMVKDVNGFIDLARARGVKRFVLVSSSGQERGSGLHGLVHDHLATIGVEYAVLRPTWFQGECARMPRYCQSADCSPENFSGPSARLNPKDSLKIYSAAGDGKIPHISCDDIAAVAFRALVDEKPLNTDPLVLGPELLSYGDVGLMFISSPSFLTYTDRGCTIRCNWTSV